MSLSAVTRSLPRVAAAAACLFVVAGCASGESARVASTPSTNATASTSSAEARTAQPPSAVAPASPGSSSVEEPGADGQAGPDSGGRAGLNAGIDEVPVDAGSSPPADAGGPVRDPGVGDVPVTQIMGFPKLDGSQELDPQTAPPVDAPPVMISAPIWLGNGRPGDVLGVDPGEWENFTSWKIDWYYCKQTCQQLPYHGRAYQLHSSDHYYTLKAAITFTNDHASDPAKRSLTAVLSTAMVPKPGTDATPFINFLKKNACMSYAGSSGRAFIMNPGNRCAAGGTANTVGTDEASGSPLPPRVYVWPTFALSEFPAKDYTPQPGPVAGMTLVVDPGKVRNGALANVDWFHCDDRGCFTVVGHHELSYRLHKDWGQKDGNGNGYTVKARLRYVNPKAPEGSRDTYVELHTKTVRK